MITVLFIAWNQNILDEQKKLDSEIKIKTLQARREPLIILLTGWLWTFFSFFLLLLPLHYIVQEQERLADRFIFWQCLRNALCFVSVGKKWCAAVGGGIFNWCCNWEETDLYVCMNVCMNCYIVNIITRKLDGGIPII